MISLSGNGNMFFMDAERCFETKLIEGDGEKASPVKNNAERERAREILEIIVGMLWFSTVVEVQL